MGGDSRNRVAVIDGKYVNKGKGGFKGKGKKGPVQNFIGGVGRGSFGGSGGKGGKFGKGSGKGKKGGFGKGKGGGKDSANNSARFDDDDGDSWGQDRNRPNRKLPGDEEVELENKFGIKIMEEGETKVGYLYNMRESRHHVGDTGREIAGLLLYFIARDGSTFRATHLYRPYFYVFSFFLMLYLVFFLCILFFYELFINNIKVLSVQILYLIIILNIK